jgi:hypothetical protein
MITANTVGGAFFVNSPFPNAVSPGDVFQIQKPSVTINKETILTFAGPNTLNMIGIKWNFVENGMAFIDHIKVRCSGCEFALNGFPLFIEVFSDFEPNAFSFPTGKNDPLNPFRPDFSNFPVGCYFHDGPVFTQWFALIGGYLCLQNVSLFAQYESNLSFATTFAKNTGFYVDGCSTFEIFGEESNGLVSVRSKCDGSDGGSTFNFSNGACTTDFAGGLDVNNSLGDAFLVKKSASVGLQDVGGTGNAGFGINQQQQGKVFYNPAASGLPTTVTGTGGDVQVGANVLTYAAIDAGPGFTDATALMRIESN